ncbi:hypothetical protein LCI18_001704 [Fusarium solani-melongenae]|uniref:Uncharacterized protein n=1 Tax=Fusarium solani subsp. cucurbitae TaxID=2747967 RepID=A0ACD3YP55_FUSSC|nr:hypothetical protein LCI18_001704 [Fusarium solani-melongenae]
MHHSGPEMSSQKSVPFPSLPCHRLRYDGPSPVHQFGQNLLSHAGNDPFTIRTWMKREDQATPMMCSGNKYRKLEYIIPDILTTPKVTTVVTEGGLQSNHAAQVSAVAAKLGLECVLLLNEESGGLVTCKNQAIFRSTGNFQIYKLLGADIKVYPGSYDKSAILGALRSEGGVPYWIPMGASTHPLGGLGYAACASEIKAQEETLRLPGSGRFDYIFLACGSGSTLGGLVAGFKRLEGDDETARASKVPRQLVGIMISHKSAFEKNVLDIAKTAGGLIGLDDDALTLDGIRLDLRFVGPGYGVFDQDTHHVLQRVARSEGVLMDPVYSGKAMRGMIHWIESGELQADALKVGHSPGSQVNVLFLHTGGQTVFSGYAS